MDKLTTELAHLRAELDSANLKQEAHQLREDVAGSVSRLVAQLERASGRVREGVHHSKEKVEEKEEEKVSGPLNYPHVCKRINHLPRRSRRRSPTTTWASVCSTDLSCIILLSCIAMHSTTQTQTHAILMCDARIS